MLFCRRALIFHLNPVMMHSQIWSSQTSGTELMPLSTTFASDHYLGSQTLSMSNEATTHNIISLDYYRYSGSNNIAPNHCPNPWKWSKEFCSHCASDATHKTMAHRACFSKGVNSSSSTNLLNLARILLSGRRRRRRGVTQTCRSSYAAGLRPHRHT